jgi:hypothetical protein
LESTEIQTHLKNIGTWQRIFFMLIFAVILDVVGILLWAVVLVQILTNLISGSPNRNLLKFARSLSVYVYRIILFVTYNSDERPFPFSDWEEHRAPD